MSFGYGFSLPGWYTTSGGFSPAQLFTGGVQGAWYDPSDLTTLFQDSAGTTPVTAVEQAVGLMLDKSKGLVLGSELVTNGTFASGTTGWTLTGGGTFTASNGIARLQNPTTPLAEATVYATITTVVGRWYTFVFTLAGSSAGQTLSVRVGTSAGGTQNATSTPVAAGTYRVIFAATATTTYITLNQNVSTADVWSDWDNVSVKALPGNHAYQSTSASRPTLRARYNLLTYSEQFDNAAWTKSATTVTANSAIAPDGTTTADTLTATSTSNIACVIQGIPVATGQTVSVYAKAGTSTFIGVQIYNAASWANFNLSTGAVASSAGCSASIVPVGNGWYRCTLGNCVNSAANLVIAGKDADPGAAPYANGNMTSGNTVFLWGAQLVPTAVFPSNTYQRVGAATDYATGAAFPPYLFFDGTDDSMLTNSIDFTGTDKMLVVAGVTKVGTGTMLMVETSADSSSNNGSLSSYVVTPGTQYAYASKGTAPFVAATTGAAAYTAPVSNVLTGISDISGDSVILRLNGAQIATNTADQGSGNYGTYPLFIGRRNNASLPFNGNIYSLVIAGAAYSAGQISSTESWVAAKTPLGTI